MPGFGINIMKSNEFIQTMQNKVAVSAVGPSALRGQGKGVLSATQTFLAKVNLTKIQKIDHRQFEIWLDRQTGSLLDKLPLKNRPWGAARKAINLFLRDALYNRYLCLHFKINKIESMLEVPLDRVIASSLKRIGKRGQLPSWPGLKWLTKPASNQFQLFASEIAMKKKIKRVHIDMYLWLENRKTMPNHSFEPDA